MWNLLNFFSNKEIDAFSRSLAQEVGTRFPVGMERKINDKKDRKTKRNLARTLQSVYTKAHEFRQAQRLGVYGKARLGNTFKWELREMGYEPDFVEEATKGLIIETSR